MDKEFFICEFCGNIVTKINDSNVPLFCCNKPITKLEVGSIEASHEKHIPVVNISNNKIIITIGEIEHPMIEEHSILWIMLITNEGEYLKYLNVGNKPIVEFIINDERPLSVYAYCNLHGLWKKDI